MRPTRERIDLSVYVKALGVFARNPTVIVLPLLASVIGVLVGQLMTDNSGLLAGLAQFIENLIELFALGGSIIIADMGWRRRRASFDEAWQDARRKGGDILFAAFGFTFVLGIAMYVGTLSTALSIILMALAVYGLIYAIAAASIGGVPGGAAINVSIERVKSAPLTAAILTVVSIALYMYLGTFIAPYVFGIGGIESPIIATLIIAAIRSIFVGYIAVVMAKVYSDVSFTMPRW